MCIEKVLRYKVVVNSASDELVPDSRRMIPIVGNEQFRCVAAPDQRRKRIDQGESERCGKLADPALKPRMRKLPRHLFLARKNDDPHLKAVRSGQVAQAFKLMAHNLPRLVD